MLKNIDTAAALSILGRKFLGTKPQEALSYLFAVTRLGYTCLTIQDQGLGLSLDPHPRQIFDDLHPEEMSLFCERVIEGLKHLPLQVVQEPLNELSLRPIVKVENSYYLQKYYSLENGIGHHITRLMEVLPQEQFSEEEIAKALDKYETHLNERQRVAIIEGLQHSLFVLTGGPGTGKTYAVNYALKVYTDLCSLRSKKPCILVVAPTGKATMLLKNKLKADEKLCTCAHVVVSTLHSALKMKRKEDLQAARVLPYDFILIDESSMVDMHLWKALFSAVREGSRVMMMGDPYQLPPVETGMIFKELAEIVPHIHLQVCMRTEQKTLIEFAEAIKTKNFIQAHHLMEASDAIRYVECDKERDIFSLGISPLLQRLREKNKNQLCLLSPILQGPWGVESLNQRMYQFFLQERQTVMTIPIMITQTDYQRELYNGDIGLLMQHCEESGGEVKDYAVFNSGVQIERAFLPSYVCAYALSVHKSQGSEFDEVILFLPEGSHHFGMEVLYTAITRAKKSITIFAKKEVFRRCLESGSIKNSRLATCISLKRKSQ